MLGYVVIMLKFFSFNSPHQHTPLFAAALNNHVDTVRCLVDKGADINVKDENEVSE